MIMEKLGIPYSDWKGYENDDFETSRGTADAKCRKAHWETAKAELQAEYDSQAYARNRKAEYDALNQLELMSDDSINGTTTHKDAIVAIKAKWPKDNSGPV